MGSKSVLCALAAAVALIWVPAAHAAFHPRLGRAMGLMPPVTHPEIASGPRQPVVFHGGTVMHGVRLHTVFWAPSGYAFSDTPAADIPGYKAAVQRFLVDAAHDSGSTGNLFSLIAQYGDGSGPGGYALSYDPATDSVDDASPYPAPSTQCSSPVGTVTCVTDLEVERELDRVITAQAPAARGLHDLWLLLLPPNVDECAQAGSCGTSDFAGYHSLLNLGHGPSVYAVIVDPLIEGVPAPGGDPEGNPEAETAENVAAHEIVEAITDPEGTGWMDPNGGEVGDKCESALGTPLGHAANGSPFNEVLNGRPYLLQTMWSNQLSGCVQRGSPSAPPALPTVSLRQFSPVVAGSSGAGRAGVSVAIGLVRGGDVAAYASTHTGTGGRWRMTLHSLFSGAPVALGDDRDILLIRYGRGGPAPEGIATDSGGDPFTEAGWTGWFDLDHGFEVGHHGVAVAPCGQTGVLALRVGGALEPSPVEQCQTEPDVAAVATRPISARTPLLFSSTDNRDGLGDAGALVRLTVALGEPDSVSAVDNPQVLLRLTGFPTCTADLRTQTVRCVGLVPHTHYTLVRRRGHLVARGRAGSGGAVRFARLAFRGGDTLTLRNRPGRTLTALHVARLRVDLRGAGRTVAGGTCQGGDYWGGPVSAPPVGTTVGTPSVGGTGIACPAAGTARGMPAGTLEQTDSFSGGVTRTEVPTFASFSPTRGATLYGPFIALAQPAVGGAPARAGVSVTITRRGARRPLRRLRGAERAQGVRVAGLPVGVYDVVWTLTDPAGDTRTVTSYFVEAG